MPKGKSYSTGNRQGKKAMDGYPGRGAADMPNESKAKKERAMGRTGGKAGTLAGSNTQVEMVDDMRYDVQHGIMHNNPYPGMRGGNYTGPGRS